MQITQLRDAITCAVRESQAPQVFRDIGWLYRKLPHLAVKPQPYSVGRLDLLVDSISAIRSRRCATIPAGEAATIPSRHFQFRPGLYPVRDRARWPLECQKVAAGADLRAVLEAARASRIAVRGDFDDPPLLR
jgi:hypothetical protein